MFRFRGAHFVKVTEFDEVKNVLMRPDLQPALISSCGNLSLLFLVAGLDEPELGLTCSSSAKIRTFYERKSLQKRKPTRLWLLTRVSAGADDMKEETIVDKIKHLVY